MAPPKLPVVLAQTDGRLPPQLPPVPYGEEKVVLPPPPPERHYLPRSPLVASLNLLGTSASGIAVAGMISHRIHPFFQSRLGPDSIPAQWTQWASRPVAFRNVAVAGLFGSGLFAFSSAYQLLNPEPPSIATDHEMHYYMIAVFLTSMANIGVGLARQKIVSQLAEEGIAFYKGAPLVEAATLTGLSRLNTLQTVSAVGALAADSWALGHQASAWEQNPDILTTAQLGLQTLLIPLFSLNRQTQSFFLARSKQKTDTERLGDAIADRIAASGIAGVERVQNPHYLAAMLLARGGLPDGYTYRAAENSTGKPSGDFDAQRVAEQLLGMEIHGEPVLGIAHEPNSLSLSRLAELIPAILRRAGVRVYAQDLASAQQRLGVGRMLRLQADHYDEAVAAGVRIGKEVEIALPPSVRRPGELFGMDETLDALQTSFVARGWEGEGWRFVQAKTEVPLGEGVKVYPAYNAHFEYNDRVYDLKYVQGTGNPMLLLFEDGLLFHYGTRKKGPVTAPSNVLVDLLRDNVEYGKRELAKKIGIPLEQVEALITSGQSKYRGLLKDARAKLHYWLFTPSTADHPAEMRLDTVRFKAGVAPDPDDLQALKLTTQATDDQEAYADFLTQLRTALELKTIELEHPTNNVLIAHNPRLTAKNGGPLELQIELTWEADDNMELVYHNLWAGGIHDEFVNLSLEAMANAGAYGTHTGAFVAHQIHISDSWGATYDAFNPSESMIPTIRVVRAFSDPEWNGLREAFPPATQRGVFIVPFRDPNVTRASEIQQRVALREIHGPQWNQKPGEDDLDHFLRVGDRIATLTERHSGIVNFDNLLAERAKRTLSPYKRQEAKLALLGDIQTNKKPADADVIKRLQGEIRRAAAKLKPITATQRGVLERLAHLTTSPAPPPTTEFRQLNTPERLTDGTLVIDPAAMYLEQKAIVARYYRAANFPEPAPPLVPKR